MAGKKRAPKGNQQKAKAANKSQAKVAVPKTPASRSSKRKASPSPAKTSAVAKKSRAASPSPAPTNRAARGRSQSTKQPEEVKAGRSASKKAPEHVTRTAVQQEEKRSARSRSSTKGSTPSTPKAETPKAEPASASRQRAGRSTSQRAASTSKKEETPKGKVNTPKSKAETPKQKAASSRARSQTPKAKAQVPEQKATPKRRSVTPRSKSGTPKQKATQKSPASNKKATPKTKQKPETPKQKQATPKQKQTASPKQASPRNEKKSTPSPKRSPKKEITETESSSPSKRTTSRSRAAKIEEAEVIETTAETAESEEAKVPEATAETGTKEKEKDETVSVEDNEVKEHKEVEDKEPADASNDDGLGDKIEDLPVDEQVDNTEDQMEVDEPDAEKEDENVEEDQDTDSVKNNAESAEAETEKNGAENEAAKEELELQSDTDNVESGGNENNDEKAESEQVEAGEKECESVESEQVEGQVPVVEDENNEPEKDTAVEVEPIVDLAGDSEDSRNTTEEPILVADDQLDENIADLDNGESVEDDTCVQEISDEDDIQEIGVTQADPIVILSEEQSGDANTTGIEIGQDAIEIIEEPEPYNGATGDGLSPKKRKHDEVEEDSLDVGDVPIKKARLSLEQTENGTGDEDVVKDYVVVEMEDVPESDSAEVVNSLPPVTAETKGLNASDASNPVLNRTFKPNPSFKGLSDPAKTFSLVSYNILADCHLFRNDYSFTEAKFLEPNHRLPKIVEELTYLDADVVCLQEVSPNFFNDLLLPSLQSAGYEGTFMKRTDDYNDEGEATFFKTSKFSLVDVHKASLASLVEKELETDGVDVHVKTAVRNYMDRPEVFIITRLKCNVTGQEVTIGNVHIHWGKLQSPDVQCVQIASTVKEIVSRAGADDFPHIICGDFNSTPNSPGYLVARDGYPSGEETFTKLQQVIGLLLPEGQTDALVNRLWPAFQHTSSSLKSAYYEAIGSEPAISSFNGVMNATVDYIFYSSSSLDNVGVLETAPKHRVMETGGTPNIYFPSDHLSLKAVLAFK